VDIFGGCFQLEHTLCLNTDSVSFPTKWLKKFSKNYNNIVLCQVWQHLSFQSITVFFYSNDVFDWILERIVLIDQSATLYQCASTTFSRSLRHCGEFCRLVASKRRFYTENTLTDATETQICRRRTCTLFSRAFNLWSEVYKGPSKGKIIAVSDSLQRLE